jgi:TolA-binding protein
MMSNYDEAEEYFTHTAKRCGKHPTAEEAEFEIARCAEGGGEHARAVQLYTEFAEKYPSSKRARLAAQAADMLRPH